MAVTVKKAQLWRRELENRPGTLAKVLSPLADAGVSLGAVMGYRIPGDESRSAVEVFPVEGKKAEDAAASAGLERFGEITCLLVQGDDRAGIGARIAQSLAEAGINLAFVMTLVTGKKYVSVMGFENERDADRAMPLIKRANLVVAGPKTAKSKTKSIVKKAGKAAQRKSIVKSKPGAKKTAAKKAGAKKTTAKKSTDKKSTAKKTTKGGAKKSTAGKMTAKRSSKSGAKRAGAKKAVAGKPSAAKKSGAGRKAGVKKSAGLKKSAGAKKPGRKAKAK